MFFRRRPYDIVLEAVHYGPDGRTIEWARGYERIFSHYSDRRLYTRKDLIRALRQGKRIAVGPRGRPCALTGVVGPRVRPRRIHTSSRSRA